MGPEKCGFECGIWTLGIIAELVFREFNVMHSPRYLCDLLKKIGLSYHNGPVARDFKERMESEGRLYVRRLPSYSPDYNPIEKLWRKIKRDATHCKYFPTFDDLRKSVIKTFEKFMRNAPALCFVCYSDYNYDSFVNTIALS
jgi:hypothetical protein